MKANTMDNSFLLGMCVSAYFVFLFFCGNIILKLGTIEEHLAVIATCADQQHFVQQPPDEPEP